MRLGIAIFTCDCGHVFESPQLSPELYGMFLLRSANGYLALMDAIEDPTYEEAHSLVKANSRIRGLSENDRVTALQDIYGELACDADPKGGAFAIGRPPPCPACSRQHIKSWDFKSPPEAIEIDIPLVTHNRWNSLALKDKQGDVDRLLLHRKPWPYVRA